MYGIIYSTRRETDMSAPTSNIVFDDIFTINGIDKEGKKFDRGILSSFSTVA